jgi:aspartate ammonia-lyase
MNPGTRTESDANGSAEIPVMALYGLQSIRARENFPGHTPFFPEWYCAMGTVKQACYQTYQAFTDALDEKGLTAKLPAPPISSAIVEAMTQAAIEVSRGEHFADFIVPAISGGAGTSINMNVNEIIANRALVMLGREPGDYAYIDPIEQANIYQSTNDVVPTALKLAIMKLLNGLEESINHLRMEMERIEGESRHILRIGRTQMQDAVPSSYGMLFSAYNEALSRDWWRVSKCFERIKVVNLGGSAIGTGIGVPRFFIVEAITRLQALTGLPLTRSENLADATSNLDTFVEVHAILKAHAVNLEKMAGDIRLLASDIAKPNDLSIPRKQTGSTIMPGKVNPVIVEYIVSSAHQVYVNDQLITSLTASGCLDLNAYLPLIGHALIDSLKLLSAMDQTFRMNLLKELKFHPEAAADRLFASPAITAALGPYIGYNQAARLAAFMQQNNCNVFAANEQLQLIPADKLTKIMRPENLLRLGFTVNEL